MLDELEVIFGRKVDMVSAETVDSPQMNPHRRASIQATATVIYHAEGTLQTLKALPP